jgi:hypothetical protein
MLKQNESKWNIKSATDAEISAAIRYLDPGSTSERLPEINNPALVICVSLVLGLVFLLSSLTFICLYYRVS